MFPHGTRSAASPRVDHRADVRRASRGRSGRRRAAPALARRRRRGGCGELDRRATGADEDRGARGPPARGRRAPRTACSAAKPSIARA